MILCDTNILIEIYKDNKAIIDVVKQIGQENVAISDVTSAELFFGARNKKVLATIKNDLIQLTTLPIQTSISGMAIDLVQKYALSHKLSLPDAIIAATAIFHNLELYTLNTRDFRFIENLRLY